MTEQSKRSAALYLAAVFIAGGAVGYALSEFSSQPTTAEASVSTASAYRRDLLRTLDERLELTDDQLNEVIVILDDIDDRYWVVRDAMEPEFEAIRHERADQVMGILNSEQQGQYSLLLDERERRREERRAERHSEQKR
jgi:hypothetical protein